MVKDAESASKIETLPERHLLELAECCIQSNLS